VTAAWQFVIEALPSGDLPATQILAIELDPRVPSLRVGARNRTGGGPEIWNRAVLRIPLDRARIGPSGLEETLQSDPAVDILETIRLGYRAEMLWSGDFIGHWSEEALSAIDRLMDLIGQQPAKTIA
jgi:hypothetical protein